MIPKEESSTAADLKSMLMALKFCKPPDNITPSMLFAKVEQKVIIEIIIFWDIKI